MKSSVVKILYLAFFWVVIVVVSGGTYYFYQLGKKQAIGQPTDPAATRDSKVVVGLPNQPTYNPEEARRLEGELFPLVLSPLFNTYNLQGEISELKIEDFELGGGYVARAYVIFEYADANGNPQRVHIPVIVDNLNTGKAVYFGYGSSEIPTSSAVIESYFEEEFVYTNNEKMLMTISFAMPQDTVDAPHTQVVLEDLIEEMHPGGFAAFSVDGDPSKLGNQEQWLIPISIYIR